ncbi:MAG: DUF3618 domain-containing protein, partial [Saccharothrix sp.]|nr:DUF3618 domain-containing protein [Saccharothrix sp.]
MSGKDLPDDPDELRADAERTRQELGDTVEALVHKTDVAGRVKDKAHEGVEHVKETATRANAAVSAAAGKATAKVGHVTEQVDKAGAAAGGKAAAVGEKTGAAAAQAGQKAGEVVGKVSAKAGEAA